MMEIKEKKASKAKATAESFIFSNAFVWMQRGGDNSRMEFNSIQFKFMRTDKKNTKKRIGKIGGVDLKE